MAIEAFATYDELCERWAGATAPDETQAEAALLDASVYLMAYLGSLYDADALTELQEAVLMQVACSIAMRSLSAGASSAGYGVSQYSQTASSFTEQMTYANPTGDVYLTSAEKKLLAQAFSIPAYYTVPCYIDFKGAR